MDSEKKRKNMSTIRSIESIEIKCLVDDGKYVKLKFDVKNPDKATIDLSNDIVYADNNYLHMKRVLTNTKKAKVEFDYENMELISVER